jgi:hypothetical protein
MKSFFLSVNNYLKLLEMGNITQKPQEERCILTPVVSYPKIMLRDPSKKNGLVVEITRTPHGWNIHTPHSTTEWYKTCCLELARYIRSCAIWHADRFVIDSNMGLQSLPIDFAHVSGSDETLHMYLNVANSIRVHDFVCSRHGTGDCFEKNSSTDTPTSINV